MSCTAKPHRRETNAGYKLDRCRCDGCTNGHRLYEKRRRHAMSRPDELWLPYVPAGPARRHVKQLMAQGVGPKTIADMSGVPHGAISKLIYGNYKGRGPSKRIRPETEAKLLAVTVDQADRAQKIDATRTWELLDDLIARGYPKAWLAKRITKNPNATGLQIRKTTVRASTARRVEALHRLLGDRPGPGRKNPWDTRRARGDQPWKKK